MLLTLTAESIPGNSEDLFLKGDLGCTPAYEHGTA